MYRVRQQDLPFQGSSHQFVGAEQGDVNISVFLLSALPGRGPGPHRHPYDEVQFVREGRGLWVVNGEEFEAGAGDILVIKAGEIHGFRCIGDAPLVQVDVHLSPRFIQENLGVMPRILVLGAGAVGGYFGGRLLEAGRDVTFLVRPQRAARLATAGLAIRSPRGDVTLPATPTVTAGALRTEYDLILLTCKAYDLEEAVRTLAPAVGPGTAILPLLNGMAHLDLLDRHFGAASVLGGFCLISSTIDTDGAILHLNPYHSLVFGERDGTDGPRVAAIAATFEGVRAEVRASRVVLHEMWEKWTFIGALAGITSLLRAPVGDIVVAGAADLATGLLDECAAIATAEGFPPGPATLERSRAMLTEPGSLLAASMLRDLERRGPTEGGHIVGDLLRRGRARSVPAPILGAAAAHLRSYEARRIREAVG